MYTILREKYKITRIMGFLNNDTTINKKEEIETITKISIDAFHSDCLIGLNPNDGPPDYDNIEWHRKMKLENHLYSYIDDNDRVIGGAILFPSTDVLYIGRIFINK